MSDEFGRDDRWQRALAGKFLDPLYRSRGWQLERYPADHPMQKKHVDVTLRRNGELHRIDEKIIRGRRDARRATKVSLETWSCSVPGRERPGWISSEEPSLATVILICNADTADVSEEGWRKVRALDAIWIPFRPLRAWFWRLGEERWELQVNQQINRSVSRKVPIREIAAAIPGVSHTPGWSRRALAMAFSPCLRKSRKSAQTTSSLSLLREPRSRPAGLRRPAGARSRRTVSCWSGGS